MANNSEYILRANASRTPQKRRENASKAGKASGEAKRRRKTLREAMLILLETDVENKEGKKVNRQEAMLVALWKKAVMGDVSAYRAIAETIGEGAAQKLELNAGITVATPDLSGLTDEQLLELMKR